MGSFDPRYLYTVLLFASSECIYRKILLLMPLFGLVWMTSWVSCFLASTHGLLKVPDYLTNALPTKVFSAINSPLEIQPPVAFPTQLHSGLWSSHTPVAAIPDFAFQMGMGGSQFRPQRTQTAVHPPRRNPALENSFCHPQSKTLEDSLPIAAVPQSTSAVGEVTSARNGSKATFSQQVLQVMQNLLPWRQRGESLNLAPSVIVVNTHSLEHVEEKQTTKERRVKHGFWQYSQRLANWAVGGATSTEKEQFQVWVKNYLIAQLPNQHQANLMAQRLKRFLSNPSDFDLDASPIEPALFDGVPAVKVGDRLLFKVDKSLATALNRDRVMLAIEWANNLRLALGKEPLKLAEAQQRIHNLVETSKTFEGLASWYGPYFHGRMTATGETYNQHELTAAHPSLPFDTYLKVRNLENGNSVIVRINDRGPFIPNRSLDLSREAARCINSETVGVVPFQAVIMQPSSPQYLVRN